MSTPRLHSLAEFLAVARHRSFTAAAAELGITPSALSQAVRQLERRVGVTLLTRTTRSVALTEAGRRLYERAAPGVEQIVEALRGLNGRSGEVTGTVRLNVPEAAVLPVLAPVLPPFTARHPGVTVEVHVDNRLVDIVAQGFDAGIRLEEFLERDMVHVRLTEPFRFVVAGSPAYLKARGTPERPRDLLAHDCIGYRSGPSGAPVAWELVRGKRMWRLAVRGPVVSNDIHLIAAMVEAGMGLGYLIEPLAADAFREGRLRRVLEPYAAEVPGWYLYFPSRAQMSPALRAFIDVARAVAVPAGRRHASGGERGAAAPANP
jgi:DNA-binding transcriptional LysR family regulator